MSGDYPKTLTHPNHRPARYSGVQNFDPHTGKPLAIRDYQGTSEVLPPVVVHNEEQEQQHIAKGYRLPGAGEVMHEYQEYPKWMSGANLPAIVATSHKHELELVAKGYDAPPKGDEKAFAEADVVPLPEGFKHVEYPKWIGDVIVQNLDEEVALMERTEPKRKKA